MLSGHFAMLWSSSSWGCELKYNAAAWKHKRMRHPLREDVSWNNPGDGRTAYDLGHPLREDVSWNVHRNSRNLFMNSHPLREDVSWNVWQSLRQWKHLGHPLREDVSWNVIENNIALGDKVILFVRMWVEMSLNCANNDIVPVILFVRMWVEMSTQSKSLKYQ